MVPLVADEEVKFVLCKNQMGHYSAHRVQVCLSSHPDKALAHWLAEWLLFGDVYRSEFNVATCCLLPIRFALHATVLQRVGEPLPEAVAAAESAREAFEASKANKQEEATAARRVHETSSSATDAGDASVNTNDKDDKVSRLVARGPDGTRGFHTTVDGKRWTGVEAWVVSDRAGILASLTYYHAYLVTIEFVAGMN